jgi:two-component system sensor histidine kinase KdpD
VEAIRDAGIDVISTCNVQHIDSVAGAVETILGVPVRERVPDEVIRSADEVELVDMSPHALRQRMRHGNVYPPDRTQVALDRFFTEANLTALRELSLRLVARRVEGQLEDALAGIELPLVTERVIVVVDGSPASGRAVRRAAVLASALRAGLVALVVETPDLERIPFDRARDLQEALDDAVDLGATTMRVTAKDPVDGIVEAARAHGARTIVLPHAGDAGLRRLMARPLADRLLERLPDADLHLVGPAAAP